MKIMIFKFNKKCNKASVVLKDADGLTIGCSLLNQAQR